MNFRSKRGKEDAMRVSKNLIARIALVCAAFILLLAMNAGTLSGAYSAANPHANAASQGMGTQPCVLSFENAGEFLSGAAPIRAVSYAGFAALTAACVLLACLYSYRKYQSKLSTQADFTPVSLCVRMDE
jgi:ABC-type Fe3+ transport system permease subunit